MHTTTLLHDPFDTSSTAATGLRAPITFVASPFGPPQQNPTSEYERRFRRRLRELGSDEVSSSHLPKRPVISTLIAALRGGNSPERVLSIARGLNPSDLALAYDHVDLLRRVACDSLDDLFYEPTVRRFHAVTPEIELLFPQAVASLRGTAASESDGFEGAVRRFETRVEDLARECDMTEALLDRGMKPAGSLVARLDDGRSGGIHHQANYRPSRVGDLTPVRLAALLGEKLKEPVR